MSIYSDRILKLADFIEPLSAKEFSFKHLVTRFDEVNQCGTNCCALGWMPAVFPQDWEWTKGSVGARINTCLLFEPTPFRDAQEYLGLSDAEVDEAFVPWGQSDVCRDDEDDPRKANYCSEWAAGTDVAENLRRIAAIVKERK